MGAKASLNNYEWAGKKRFFDPLDDGRLLWLVQRVQSINHKCINQAGRSAASELTASLNNRNRKKVNCIKYFKHRFIGKFAWREKGMQDRKVHSAKAALYTLESL